ncbi:MAG: protein kinase [Candidatus Aureabacteria bacterium]|nr:protein kinase [Candidatus Auribacterota bacterium]
MIGKTLGNYKIEKELGRGGMGVVYLAHQTSLNRKVAIKVLPSSLAQDSQLVERFLREARAAARLDHPNIVTIHDVSEYEGTYFIAMKLLEGKTLKDIIKQKGRLTPDEAVSVMIQIADALQYAHEKGIIHRDIKSPNIIIEKSGRAVLTDFGIARAATDTRLTMTGMMVGSPGYMSPEQAQGKDVDSRADLYSLGACFFEMLTGKTPYEGDTPFSIAYKHINEPVRSPQELIPDIPHAVDAIVKKLMAKNPEDRFASAGLLLSELKKLSPETVQPLEQGTIALKKEEKKKRIPKKSALLWISAILVVIGIITAFALFTKKAHIKTAEKAAEPIESEKPKQSDFTVEEPELKDKNVFKPPLKVAWKIIENIPGEKKVWYWTSVNSIEPNILLVDFHDGTGAVDKKTGEIIWRNKEDHNSIRVFQGNKTMVFRKVPMAEAEPEPGKEKEPEPKNIINVDIYNIKDGSRISSTPLPNGFNHDAWLIDGYLYVRYTKDKSWRSLRRLLKFDMDKKKILWNTELNNEWFSLKNYPDLLLLTYNHRVVMIDPKTGVIKWEHVSEDEIFPKPVNIKGDLYYGTGWADELTYIMVDYKKDLRQRGFRLDHYSNTIYKVDPSNGTTLWETTTPSAPALIEPGDKYAYVSTWGRWDFDEGKWKDKSYLITLDLKTGSITSQKESDGFLSPVIHDKGVLYTVKSPAPESATLYSGIAPPEPEPAHERYRNEEDIPPPKKPYPDTPLKVMALDAQDSHVIWERELDAESFHFMRLLKDNLLIRTLEKDLICISTKDGTIKWRFRLDPSSNMKYLSDTLYVISYADYDWDTGEFHKPSYLNAIDIDKGEIVWRQEFQGNLSTFQHDDKRIYFTVINKGFYTFYCLEKG